MTNYNQAAEQATTQQDEMRKRDALCRQLVGTIIARNAELEALRELKTRYICGKATPDEVTSAITRSTASSSDGELRKVLANVKQLVLLNQKQTACDVIDRALAARAALSAPRADGSMYGTISELPKDVYEMPDADTHILVAECTSEKYAEKIVAALNGVHVSRPDLLRLKEIRERQRTRPVEAVSDIEFLLNIIDSAAVPAAPQQEDEYNAELSQERLETAVRLALDGLRDRCGNAAVAWFQSEYKDAAARVKDADEQSVFALRNGIPTLTGATLPLPAPPVEEGK